MAFKGSSVRRIPPYILFKCIQRERVILDFTAKEPLKMLMFIETAFMISDEKRG